MNVAMPMAAVLLDLGFRRRHRQGRADPRPDGRAARHLAEEQQHPIGFQLAERPRPSSTSRVMLEPEVEALPWEEQLALDDASYRAQLAYLRERSAFYRREARRQRHRRRARRHRSASAHREGRAAGDPHAREPVRNAPLRRAARARPDLLDERHDRSAELRPADRGRPRRLGRGLRAELRRLRDRSWPADRLDLQRRAVRRRRRARRFRPDRPLPHPGRHGEHRTARPRDRAAAPEAAVRRLPMRPTSPRGTSDLRTSSAQRLLVAGEPGGGEPAFRAKLEEGLGREWSPRRWASATSASRSGASASSRTACTSARAGSCTPS